MTVIQIICKKGFLSHFNLSIRNEFFKLITVTLQCLIKLNRKLNRWLHKREIVNFCDQDEIQFLI